MTVLSCSSAEEILARTPPPEVERALRGPGGELSDHLASCAGCAELARGIVALRHLSPGPAPSAEVLRRALHAASAELRVTASARRRRARGSALRTLFAFLLGMPAVVAAHAAFGFALVTWVTPLVPGPARLYVEITAVVLALAALSSVVFLLTLLAGAGAAPPRPELLEA